MEKLCIFYGVKETIGLEADGKIYPNLKESIGINLPDPLNLIDITVFSSTMGD